MDGPPIEVLHLEAARKIGKKGWTDLHFMHSWPVNIIPLCGDAAAQPPLEIIEEQSTSRSRKKGVDYHAAVHKMKCA